MPNASKQELQEHLDGAEEVLDEIAGILADDELEDAEKVAALEELIFDSA